MNKRIGDSFSLDGMAVIIFIGSQFLFFNYISSGPNMDYSLGWVDINIKLNARKYGWSVARFRFGFLVVNVVLSVALAWTFSTMLKRRMS